MTKKILKLGLTITILAGIIFAGAAFAQQMQPNDCCKIRAGFSTKGFNLRTSAGTPLTIQSINSGVVVGAEGTGAVCDLDQDGSNDWGTGAVRTKDWGLLCMLGTIYLITKWLFIIIMSVVTIMIVYGGFLIITAAGDPEKAGKGKKVVTYAVIGLAVALLARVIPSLVRFIIGV